MGHAKRINEDVYQHPGATQGVICVGTYLHKILGNEEKIKNIKTKTKQNQKKNLIRRKSSHFYMISTMLFWCRPSLPCPVLYIQNETNPKILLKRDDYKLRSPKYILTLNKATNMDQ